MDDSGRRFAFLIELVQSNHYDRAQRMRNSRELSAEGVLHNSKENT